MAGKRGVVAPQEVQYEEVELLEDEQEGAVTEKLPEFEGENGEAVLFPGGPSLDRVEEWRSRFKDIFLTEFDDGEVVVWRSLVRKEYKDIMKIQGADNFYKEERICERVVLWPENYGFMAMAQGKAGIPTLIAELVMEKSGFQAKTGAMRL
jgi:hypothetical protein